SASRPAVPDCAPATAISSRKAGIAASSRAASWRWATSPASAGAASHDARSASPGPVSAAPTRWKSGARANTPRPPPEAGRGSRVGVRGLGTQGRLRTRSPERGPVLGEAGAARGEIGEIAGDPPGAALDEAHAQLELAHPGHEHRVRDDQAGERGGGSAGGDP